MNEYLRILVFEARTRWPLIFLSIAYFACFLPLVSAPKYAPYYLPLSPGLFFILQTALLVCPIFQNRPWGSSDPRVASLDFSFTRALSRTKIFWAKATIYLVAVAMFGVSGLVFASIKPEVKIALPRQAAEAEARWAFLEENFAGAHIEESTDKRGGQTAVLPEGNTSIALGVLLGSVGLAVVYQLLLMFLPETKLATFATIIIAFALFLGAQSLFLLGGERPTASFYEIGIGYITRHPIPIFTGLVLLVAAVEFYCSRKFIRKEIL